MDTVMKRNGGAERKKARFGIQKIVLKTLAHAGMLSVAMLAPKALKVFTEISGSGTALGFPQRIERSIHGLIRSGDIEWRQTPRGKVLRLTEGGERKLSKLSLSDISGKRRRWDQRWRIVMYDIKETQKGKRQMLRNALVHIGFYRLQDSVWVYPHECSELILLLRTEFQLGRNVQYLEVDHIENDKTLIRHFSALII